MKDEIFTNCYDVFRAFEDGLSQQLLKWTRDSAAENCQKSCCAGNLIIEGADTGLFFIARFNTVT